MCKPYKCSKVHDKSSDNIFSTYIIHIFLNLCSLKKVPIMFGFVILKYYKIKLIIENMRLQNRLGYNSLNIIGTFLNLKRMC